MCTQHDQWVPLSEAADYYKVSTDTIRRMATRGEIEARRFGPRLIRVRLLDIEAASRPVQFIGGDAE